MIGEAELRRQAAASGVELAIADLDYALGCFLASLYRHQRAGALRFKGGTCLRKCYHPDYRFSVDLDFTLVEELDRRGLQRLLEQVVSAATDEWGMDFGTNPLKVETVDDDYGRESYSARLYYRGPLRMRGDPRAIRIDVTTAEALAFAASVRPIIHPYSDQGLLAEVRVPCYDPLEMAAEKVRALSGQRKYAISRDVYDLDQLMRRHSLDMGELASALPAKFRAKGLDAGEVGPEKLDTREEEFRQDWNRNVVYLIAHAADIDFNEAWRNSMSLLQLLAERLKKAGPSDDPASNVRA